VVATADVIAGRCPPADLEEALAVAGERLHSKEKRKERWGRMTAWGES